MQNASNEKCLKLKPNTIHKGLRGEIAQPSKTRNAKNIKFRK